ncbi:pseudouridine synthase [Parapusillimonas sp. SGNA-6]|nr:pseudouridine synthase [Parapusillimonas sp. SGNA-6]
MRDGVAASRVYLPPGPWHTVGEFLSARFPYVPAQVLADRLTRGEIVDDAGVPQSAGQPYVPRRWLWYYREVPDEPTVPFDMPVLHRDDYLVVVDKPHFLASIPGGRHLRETALTRLRKSLDLPCLSPVHRLDRDTAGVLLFCVDPALRGAYQVLFQTHRVRKQYEAIAPLLPGLQLPRTHRSRLMPVPGRFTVCEVEGEANSETHIELVEPVSIRDETPAAAAGEGATRAAGLYRLTPTTGRKHQLRAHMSALGIPIHNDTFYPELLAHPDAGDYTRPLQLLARAIEFVDPVTGRDRCFRSQRVLQAAPATPRRASRGRGGLALSTGRNRTE